MNKPRIFQDKKKKCAIEKISRLPSFKSSHLIMLLRGWKKRPRENSSRKKPLLHNVKYNKNENGDTKEKENLVS